MRVLRPPISTGDEGTIHSVSISPDGELVAAGGWTFDNDVYLFDRRTGRLVRRLRGLRTTTGYLTFDRAGQRLAVCLSDYGLRVFSVADGKELRSDETYLEGSYGASFDCDGRLVTSCFDGKLRLYDEKLARVAEVEAPGGKLPIGVAFSPDGQRIAVGYDDSARVDILSGADLELLYTADTDGAD